jgi:hypothetical protein
MTQNPTTNTEAGAVADVAGKLTKAQREAVCLDLTPGWQAGPNLDDATIDCLYDLRELVIVERHFADTGPVERGTCADGQSLRIGACWYFRLTPLGLLVKAHLSEQGASAGVVGGKERG